MEQEKTEEQPVNPKPPEPWWSDQSWIGSFLDQITVIVGMIIVYLLQRNAKKFEENFDEIFNQNKKANSAVRDTLNEIRILVNADRVLLNQFHNGNKWASGLHFDKMTASHEVTDPNVEEVSEKTVDVPLEKLEEELDYLINKSDILIIDEEDSEDRWARYLHGIGVRRCIKLLVRQENGNLIGEVSIHYLERRNIPGIEEESLEKVKRCCSRIGDILTPKEKRNPIKALFS
jgi:hypothetical protein